MTFSTPQAAAVFADYEARRLAEVDLMNDLPRRGLAGRDELLLSVGLEAAVFLHSLVLAHRPTRILELGTSYGYSTLFLADAANAVGATLITMELAENKQAYARDKITEAGLADVVDFRLGDAVAMIGADPGPFDLVLLDIWKELYLPCFEAF
jgi:predicted O-methyltransferase YrrM